MKLEKIHSSTYQVTLHAYELAALISAARWIVNGTKGELPEDAVQQLNKILTAYDAEAKKMSKTG